MASLSRTNKTRPIFVVTHPRSCSTAFERVFMTRRDVLECSHEPFGDAFYYGPERLSERYDDDEAARSQSGLAECTYKDVMDRLSTSAPEGKRLFIKDMAYYLFPTGGEPAQIAPSLTAGAGGEPNGHRKANDMAHGEGNGLSQVNGLRNGAVNGAGTNPTVVPLDLLRGFHFTFLIRHPRRSIPSYYRCTVPPLDKVTGFSEFVPGEAGYAELRRLFDYLRSNGVVGPHRAGDQQGEQEQSHVSANGNGVIGSAAEDRVGITVVDADDLLDNPSAVIRTFCDEVGLEYSPEMLRWEDEDNQEYAAKAFQKWNGFHEDVLGSTYLKPRTHGCKTVTTESEDSEWREKYGEEAQKFIRKCVDDNVADYEYLKTFALKV